MKRLRLATKLALAIIPIGLVALAAGALVARNALDRAEHEERASVAAVVAADAMDSLAAFSEEHSLAVGIAVGNTEGNIEGRRTATDNALAQLSESVRELTPLASGPASGIAASILGDSSQVRSLTEQLREVDPTSAESAEIVTEIGDRLISVVTQSTFYLGDETRAREGEGAVALARASFTSLREELLISQHEFDQFLDDETFAQQMLVLETTVEDWINTAADSSPTVQAHGFTRTQVLAEDEGFTSDTFPVDRNTVLADAAGEILVRVSGSAEAIAAEARAEAGTVGAIVIAALALAAITALVVGRSTTKRVRSITAAAHHVAEVDLPRMVDSLSNPSGVLEATAPVDVDQTGKDEVGDLARSFSTLHTTLVDVANRQMETLRTGVSDIFVTLARRNRSLVDRQLALVDQLEAKEEDPEVLDGYYKLDHLATRMRRNAESLLVLAGTESPRMWSEPIEMGEVVRAALGEVDEYQRIEVLAMEPSLLAGRAVTDVSHLVSELLDNATQFSAPTERVRVTGLFDDAGYVVTIADSGVGMSSERMGELNHLIENPPVLGLALEPTLGMYVVARLAMRHGIKVKLVAGVPGTTVRVTIPRELLESSKTKPIQPPTDLSSKAVEETPRHEEPTVTAGAGIPPPAPNGSDHGVESAEELERSWQVPSGNGVATPTPSPLPSRPRTDTIGGNGAGLTSGKADTAATADSKTPDTVDEAKTVEGPKTPEPARPTPSTHPAAPTPQTLPMSPPGSTPRHVASPPPNPGQREPTEPEQGQRPAAKGSLPTRLPGTSFRETTDVVPSSTSSRSGATGIREALDGFRQGRDIATKRDEGDGGDDNEDVT